MQKPTLFISPAAANRAAQALIQLGRAVAASILPRRERDSLGWIAVITLADRSVITL